MNLEIKRINVFHGIGMFLLTALVFLGSNLRQARADAWDDYFWWKGVADANWADASESMNEQEGISYQYHSRSSCLEWYITEYSIRASEFTYSQRQQILSAIASAEDSLLYAYGPIQDGEWELGGEYLSAVWKYNQAVGQVTPPNQEPALAALTMQTAAGQFEEAEDNFYTAWTYLEAASNYLLVLEGFLGTPP